MATQGGHQMQGKLARSVALGAIIGSLHVAAQAQEVEFWTQPYGDLIAWKQSIEALADEFEAESGITVNYEPINWSVAFRRWLTVAQGGPAPDCADMFFLHSFSAIGGTEHGPLPLNEYRDSTWPALDTDFFTGSLQDVTWSGDFYGIPWRGDVRPMMYRTDHFEVAGLTAPPDTWDELVEHAKKLTLRDENGNVTQWGFGLGNNNIGQSFPPLYWQAGGEMMTEDGRTATIDNEAMRTALQFLKDLVWTHEVLDPDFMEKGNDTGEAFLAGKVSIVGSVPGGWPSNWTVEYPELNDKWALAVPAAGPEGRDAYSGSGYFGVLRGSENVESCVKWIEFLSREENMQVLSEASGNVSPHRGVMNSEFWSDTEWKSVLTESLEFAHTSQHPSPVWNALAADEAGAVIYDMVYDVVIRQADMDETIKRAEERMQAEMDRAFNK
ncbi:extracellular solute-binding protein [Marinovum algicola]